MKKIFSLYLLLFTTTLFAQQVKKPINSSEILEEYRKLYADDKYDESLAEIQKIDKNDTSYAVALVEKSVSYIQLEKYEEAVKTCEEGLKLNTDFNDKFYTNMSVALNRLKKYKESHKILDEALSKYPKSYFLTYNKGTAYLAEEKYPEAISYFKKTIQVNPFHALSHLELALLAIDEGKITQAMLSMNMFLVLEPNTKRAFSVLQRFNEVVSSKYTREPKNINLSPEGGDDFSELDLIITNYAALAKGFKVPVKTDLAVIKQNYALFSKMTYDKDDKGFWMQTYVPFFKELYVQQQFPGFSYYILQSSQNKVHIDLIKKNMPAINKFITWAGPAVDKTTALYVDTLNGKKQIFKHWFDAEKHTLSGIGPEESNGKKTGFYRFFYSNGVRRSEGSFDANEERTGPWTFYYNNGAKEQECIYKNGKPEGKLLYYNSEGVVIAELYYTEGKLNGEKKIYNGSGLLTDKNLFKTGELDGEQFEYYKLGEKYINSKVKYVNGEVNDSIYLYHDNGKLKSVRYYTNKALNGNYTNYYKTGKIQSKGKYVNGLDEGEFVLYYENGQIHKKGSYLKGIAVGKWSIYNYNGTLHEESLYDEKGNLNGINKSYYEDGKLNSEIEYSNGLISSFRFYNPEGGIIKEEKKSKGEINFTYYHPTGTKRSEGIYTQIGRKGTWKYYDIYENMTYEEPFNNKGIVDGITKNYDNTGTLIGTTTYVNDVKEGPSFEYFKTGKLKTEVWYTKDQSNGYVYTYYPDGTLETKAYFLNDELSGIKEFYTVTGKLEKEEFYKDKMLQRIILYDTLKKVTDSVILKSGTGNFIVKHPNGKIKFSGNYVEGISHGKYTWYYFDGNTQIEGDYFNDEKHGLWKWYYEDKKLSNDGNYLYGKKDGKWQQYHPNGKLKEIENYENGVLNGEYISYYDNGQIETKKTYVNGEETGEGLYYGMDGELQIKRFFKNGIVTSYTYYDATGKFVTPISIVNGSANIVTYYKNGNKAREFILTGGAFRNGYKEYHSNGKLAEEIPYKNDEIIGAHKIYYPNGNLKQELNYITDNNMDGVSKYYYPDGKIESEMIYKNGLRHGDSRYYNAAGKLIKKEFYYSGDILTQELY